MATRLIKFNRRHIPDIERLQRYERIFHTVLSLDRFSKSDVYRCGENKSLVGRIVNSLILEGALLQDGNGKFEWEESRKELYEREWKKTTSTHQLKRLPKTDRPREKLLYYGAQKLTTPELLAIFLRTGIRGKSAIGLSTELLERFGGVRGIFEAPKGEILSIDGLGEAKVAQIKAVHALAEAYLEEKVKSKRIVRNSKEVYDYLYHTLRDLKKEIFKVIFLDGKNQIIGITDLFEGTLNSSSIYPREVIKYAIQNNAASLIFAHNHPSGNPEPSESDKDITKDLTFAGNIMQIRILDHIIIGDNTYFSFADGGLIEEYYENFLELHGR